MALKSIKNWKIRNLSEKLRKCLYGLVLGLCGAVMITSCSTVKYVPVKGDTVVEYRDSIITRLDTVTVYRTNTEKVRDFTGGLLDTLHLETKSAVASAYVDTTSNTLKGSLEDKDVPLEVVVPIKEEFHNKDSVSIKEVPVEVEIVREVEVIPKFWRVTGVIGIISILMLLGFVGFKIWKLKGEGFLSVFKKLKIK